MKNRTQRLELILKVIREREIGSQEELVRILRHQHFNVTQATLSRDLKILKIKKLLNDSGRFVYTFTEPQEVEGINALAPSGSRKNYEAGFISLTFSGNMAVIKTRNGYAAGLAYDIDMHHIPEILGTIPGSDTIFAVLSEDADHEATRKSLAKILPL